MKNELKPDNPNRILTASTLLKIGEQYYQTRMLNPAEFRISGYGNSDKNFNLGDGIELDPSIAYLNGDYYYFYRGKLSDLKRFDKILPGIYYDDERWIRYCPDK